MSDFILLFWEREGSTAMVRALDLIDGISILHKEDRSGWEPFDTNHMRVRQEPFQRVLDAVGRRDRDAAQEIYGCFNKTDHPLTFDPDAIALGFKVRFRTYDFEQLATALPGFGIRFLFRRDIFAYSISRYHGDGNFKRGHMQFKKRANNEFQPFDVDLDAFDDIVRGAIEMNQEKIDLFEKLRAQGAAPQAIFYEDFLEDRAGVLQSIALDRGVEIDREAAQAALDAQPLRKVHDRPFADFVLNLEAAREVCDQRTPPDFSRVASGG